jgi:biopolymer transport protein ExbD
MTVFKSVRSRKTLTAPTEIQMTPLIDMVFILLIFFVVTTSFVAETGVGIERPQANLSESLPRESITMAVRADGQIILDGQEMGLFSVRPHLERSVRNQPGLSAVIVADRTVPIERIVRVMDEIRAAGVIDIALATERTE